MKRVIVVFAVLVSFLPAAWGQGSRLYKEGYYGNVSAVSGIVMAKGISDREFSVETCHGYSFGNGAFFGAGIGVKDWSGDDGLMMPLFADFKYAFVDNELTPFVDMKGGVIAGSTYGASFMRFGGGVDSGRLSMSLNYQLEGGAAYRLHSINIAFGINF